MRFVASLPKGGVERGCVAVCVVFAIDFQHTGTTKPNTPVITVEYSRSLWSNQHHYCGVNQRPATYLFRSLAGYFCVPRASGEGEIGLLP